MITNPVVAFCETSGQVDYFLANKEYSKSIQVFLAIEPDAAWALRSQGIQYAKLEDFYDEYTLDELSNFVLQRQIEWAEWINQYLQSHIPEFEEYGFQPSLYSFYLTKNYMESLLLRAYMLEEFYKAVKPSKIYYFENPKDSPHITLDYMITHPFLPSYYPSIIPAWAKKNDVEAIKLKFLEKKFSTHQLQNTLRGKIISYLPDNLRFRLQSLEKKAKKVIAKQEKFPDDWSEILIMHEGFDIRKLILEFPKYGIKPISWDNWKDKIGFDAEYVDSGVARTLINLWDNVQTNEKLWRPYNLIGFDLHEIAREWVEDWWKRDFGKMWEVFIKTRRGLKKRKPFAILAPLTWQLHEAPVFHAARSLGIPTFIYQHGQIGSIKCLDWEMTDLFNSDYFLTYGEKVSDYLNERRNHYSNRGQPLTVGSARLEALRSQEGTKRASSLRGKLRGRENRYVVLFVPTLVTGNARLFCSCSYPDIDTFEVQLAVLELFGQFPDIQFIWKTFDDRVKNPLSRLIKESYPNVFEISLFERNMPLLTELMWVVDAIILDHLATPILECLLTRKPIILKPNKAAKLSLTAEKMLKKRCVLTRNREEFIMEIKQLLSEKKFSEIENPDNSFLEAYGVYKNDNMSSKRAVKVILEISKEAGNVRYFQSNANAKV